MAAYLKWYTKTLSFIDARTVVSTVARQHVAAQLKWYTKTLSFIDIDRSFLSHFFAIKNSMGH